MAFKDLREFLAELETKGDLKRVTAEVDWNLEIYAIMEESRRKNGPAMLFENIKDYKEVHGKKMAVNFLADFKKAALALNLPKDTCPLELVKVWRERTKRPIKPILLSTGPCKEVIEKGKDINVLEFPILKKRALDGGRYTTWQLCVTKDPETGWVNVGMYNAMVHNETSLGITAFHGKHGDIHARKYHAMGKPLPMAIVKGAEPVSEWAACSPFKVGVNEYDMAGGLREEPMELVKCETVDLEVPATAEIVIEGLLSYEPDTFKSMGLYGRYTGYSLSVEGQTPTPVMEITCITHRNDPIFDCYRGGPISGIASNAFIWDQLEELGVEEVTGVWSDPSLPGLSHITIISINTMYYGHAKRVANAVWALPEYLGKFVIVVDSDVNIFDWREVMAAISNRCRGQQDVIIFPYTAGSILDPSTDTEFNKRAKRANWDRVLIDATWPFEWEPREEWGWQKIPPTAESDPKTLEKVKNRWKEYGI